MATVGSLTVDLIAQTASFNSNIEKAARNLNTNAARMNKSLDSVKRNISAMRAEAEGLALGKAIRQFGEFVKKNLDLAGSLGETAQQVGVTARQLQVYRAIGGQVGVTQEEMDKGLSKLTVSLGQASVGAKAQGTAFAALGISVRDANGHVKTAGDVLPEIADKLRTIQDPAQRAAAEIALFGRAGQKLDTVLTGGSDGIDAYAKEAENLGMILSDDVIQNADAAADKMEQLNAQLTANIANAVAQNAGAILGLANALTNLTVKAINFVNTYPKLAAALAGAAAGSRFGLPGAVAGAGAGFLGGMVLQGNNSDANMDLRFRAKALREAGANYARSVRSGDHSGETKRAYEKQQQLAARAMATAKLAPAAPPPQVNLPDFLASPGAKGSHPRSPKGPNPETARQRAIRQKEAFDTELARLDQDLLSAKRDNLTDVSMIAELDRQQLTVEADKLKIGVAADVAAGKYTKAQGEQLSVKIDQVKAEKLLTINTEEMQRKAHDALDLQLAANDNQRDLLGAQEQLAVTQKDRRTIQLKLLDLERREEELKLRNILLMSKDVAERQNAQARLNALPEIYGARAQGVKQQTAGPLEAYGQSLALSKDQINEAIQGIKVNGLEALNQGLVDAIMGVRSLGDVFRSVANQILADLLRIQIQKAIIGPLMALIGGGAGPSASLLGSASATIAANPAIFATGGHVKGPGSATSDSILARLSNGEFVMNAAAVSRIGVANLDMMNKGHPRYAIGGFVGRTPAFHGNDNRGGAPVHIHMNGAASDKEARRTGMQAARAYREETARLVRMGG